MNLELTEIALADIIADPENERGPIDPHAENIHGLTASINRRGIVEPIRLIRLSEHQYMIHFGHRRVEAARAASITKIPALVWNTIPTPEERAIDRLISNVQRENLSGLQISDALHALLEAYPNLAQQDLAIMLGYSPTTLSKLLRLRTLPDTVRALLQTGGLSPTHAFELLTIHEAEYGIGGRPTGRTAAQVQTTFAQEAAKTGRTVLELHRIVDEYLRLQRQNRAKHKPNHTPLFPHIDQPSMYPQQASAPPRIGIGTQARAQEVEQQAARHAEIVAARQEVAHATIDRMLVATDDAIPPPLRIGAWLAVQGAGVPPAPWINRIEGAATPAQLLIILQELGREALTLNPQAHGLAAENEINTRADARWHLSAGIADALWAAELLPARLRTVWK